MPSGNAIYTYTGPTASEYVQGQIFLKDQPKHITDQGVIAVCAGRKDFQPLDPIYAATAADVDFAENYEFRSVMNKPTPAKPKKAKSK